jgi:hypothetical protein
VVCVLQDECPKASKFTGHSAKWASRLCRDNHSCCDRDLPELQAIAKVPVKCDRVKISRSDGYRPLTLSSVCDCIIEEDGESSRHDHSRE